MSCFQFGILISKRRMLAHTCLCVCYTSLGDLGLELFAHRVGDCVVFIFVNLSGLFLKSITMSTAFLLGLLMGLKIRFTELLSSRGVLPVPCNTCQCAHRPNSPGNQVCKRD